MVKKWILILIGVFALFNGYGQQYPVDNQYLVNRFALSPAYAGLTENIETFLGYRQAWFGIEGAPQKQMLSINGPATSNTGFGVRFNHYRTGNFAHFAGDFNYAYHLDLGTDHSVSFGVGGQVYRNQVEIKSIKSNGQDPMLAKLQVLEGTTFNASAGAVYRINNLNAGVVLPRMLPMEINYIDSSKYQMAQKYLVHASYALQTGDFEIEPFALFRGTMNNSSFEGSVLATYKEKAWMGVNYRQGNIFGISAGVALNEDIVINYSYETGSNNMLALSSGTHEISVGFLMKRHEGDHNYLTGFPPLEEKRETEGTSEETAKKITSLKQNYKLDSIKKEKRINELEEKVNELEASKDESSEEEDEAEYAEAFILKNIKFATNSDKLFDSSLPALNKLAIEMRKNESLEIKITGHTDSEGSTAYNKRLSKKRAQAVKDYLVEKRSISADRIVTAGKGESDPRASNETPAGRAKNRRIVVQFKK